MSIKHLREKVQIFQGEDKENFRNSTFLQSKTIYEQDVTIYTITIKMRDRTRIPQNVTNKKLIT